MLRVLLGIYISLLVITPVIGIAPITTVGGDFEVSYSLLTLVAFNALFFLNYFSKGPTTIVNKAYLALLLLFVFSVCIAWLNNPDYILSSLSLLVQFLMQTTILAYLATITRRKKLSSFWHFLHLFAFVNCIFVYISYFFPDAVGQFTEVHGYFGYAKKERPDYIRAFGIMGDAAPWFLSFFACWHLQIKQYARYGFYAGSAVVGSSFGASLLVVAMSYFTLIWNNKDRVKAHLYLIGGVTAASALVLVLQPELITQISLVRRLNDTAVFSEGSGVQRLFSVGLAMEYILKNPLFGYGYGTYLYNLQKDLGYLINHLGFGYGALSNANNQFLQSWYEFGLLGLVIIGFLVWYILRHMKRYIYFTKPQDRLVEFKKAGFIWFVSFLLANQTAVYTIPSIMWVLICCIIGSCFSINNIIGIEGTSVTAHTRHSRV